MTNSFQNGRD